jgi:hypothetical protein
MKSIADLSKTEREEHIKQQTRASEIERMLGDHIRRCQQRDNSLDAEGEELDGYLNEALEAMALIYGKTESRGPEQTPQRTRDSPRRDRKKNSQTVRAVSVSSEKTTEKGTEVQQLSKILSQFVTQLQEGGSPDRKRLKKEEATASQPNKDKPAKPKASQPKRDKGKDKPKGKDEAQVVNASWQKKRAPTTEEIELHSRDTNPNASRRCRICGSEDHLQGACDCAFLPSDEDGLAGKFSLSRFISSCIGPFNTLADSRAEFSTRVDNLRHTYDYTGGDDENIIRAATRWKQDLPQIQSAYQKALSLRKYPP